MWIYNLGLTLYAWAIRLAACRHAKARLWIDGRKELLHRMKEVIAPGERIVWVHVASLGEFEQGRPLVERYAANTPNIRF